MYVVTLEISGKMLSSEELAEKINSLGLAGKSSIAFVIGGSIGLGKKCCQGLTMHSVFQNDIPASAYAGDPAGAGVSELQDHQWITISQINAVFSQLGAIWHEVMDNL